MDEESHQPLWATIVGRDTADLPHASTVAIVGGMQPVIRFDWRRVSMSCRRDVVVDFGTGVVSTGQI